MTTQPNNYNVLGIMTATHITWISYFGTEGDHIMLLLPLLTVYRVIILLGIVTTNHIIRFIIMMGIVIILTFWMITWLG